MTEVDENSARKDKKPEVVVITGASAGLGRAIVRKFAQDGAHIGLVARGRDGLEGAKKDVENLGGKAIIIRGDVADPEATERAAEETEKAFGEIDIWINDAMVSVFSPVKEMKAEEPKRVTEVTYLGRFWKPTVWSNVSVSGLLPIFSRKIIFRPNRFKAVSV